MQRNILALALGASMIGAAALAACPNALVLGASEIADFLRKAES